MLLAEDISRNTITLNSLADCLAAAEDDELRATANVEKLQAELASSRGRDMPPKVNAQDYADYG